MNRDPVVIVAARRSPIGAFQGALLPLAATDIAASVSRAAIGDSGLQAGDVQEVLMGCVLPAGLGQAPARQAALAAGIPEHVPCTTVNKICGSGMKTVLLGHDLLLAGTADVVLAGGMESMSNAPYLMPKARAGYRMGHQQVLDHMFYDGLQNPYDGNMMGYFGERTAAHYGFTREQQDAFAIASVERARAAQAEGRFADELVPLTVATRREQRVVDADEGPTVLDTAKIPSLRPAFAEDGTVTAASSSSISDGAAALVLMRRSEAERRSIAPLATICGGSGFAHAPEWFTTAPVHAIRALHEKLGWGPESVDLYEVNEAFACVTMAAMQDVGIPHDKMNVNGGACALGHPIGATGARITVTLLHALRARGGGRGIASLCIGGGEALAIALEVD